MLRWLSLFHCLVVVVGLQEEGQLIQATDSDYLNLVSKATTLPGVTGDGVFARNDLSANEILCEYRGPVIADSANYESDKRLSFEIIDPGTDSLQRYSIVGSNLCSLVNDIVDIDSAKYSLEQLREMKLNDTSFPVHQGFSYNAHKISTASGKVFVASSIDIPAGSEIFFPYDRFGFID